MPSAITHPAAPTLKPRNGPVRLSLVVPVFNEQDSIAGFVNACDQALDPLVRAGTAIELVFVNDGSSDATLETLLAMAVQDARLVVVDLSRNFGKEAALSAGLEVAGGDAVVPIDVDLQDPPDLIPEMVRLWRDGWEVVLAARADRSSDSWAKRNGAGWFYRVHNSISEPRIPADVGDFRLMDRAVVDVIRKLPESRRFMKGLFAWAGFRTTSITFSRPSRAAGKSRFNSWRLWNLALEGLTSFSTVPLRVWSYLGLLVSGLAFVFAVFLVIRVLVHGIDVPGYASLMVATMLLGGLQLLGIGILGEYLGRTYIESKRRPVFVISRIYRTEP